MENVIFLCLALMMCAATRGQKTDCTEDDLHYTYTECDSDQRRWRVRVPKSDRHCQIKSPAVPVEGPLCDKSCDAGKYLDVEGSQECKDCKPGTYSVGDGIRYDQWTELPKGFSVSESTMLQFTKPMSDCSNTTHKGWVARGEYLEGVPRDCSTDLIITAELITSGTLTVVYSNSLNLLGIIQVKSLCQPGSSSAIINEFDGITTLPKTRNGGYETSKVDMVPGKNKITFSMFGLTESTPGHRFTIQSIEIKGMGFSTECATCKPGYYSSSGASYCTHCAEDTYAPDSGATSCKDCEKEDYSPPASKECKPRPPCKENDYYASISPCVNKAAHETYDWLKPKYCNDKHADSVALPVPGNSTECPPCNPGQALNSSGVCEYCAEGMFSGGYKPCESCPLQSEARKTLTFTHFDVMPKGLITGCIKTSGGGSFCDKQSTWVPKGSYIQVSDDIGDMEFAVLNVNVSQFSNNSIDGRVYGRMYIKFNLTCEPDDPCLLYLMEEDTEERSFMTWNSSTTTVYHYNFTSPRVRMISVAFRKSVGHTERASVNTLKILELQLTNTVTGGAAECTPCVLASSVDQGCHTCSVGEVIVTNNSTNEKLCQKCPPNHVVRDSFTCEPCGYGLVNSADHTTCVSNCEYTSVDGMTFHLAPLSGLHYTNISLTYTTDGTPYFSGLNFTLCSCDLSAITKPMCGGRSKSGHRLKLHSVKDFSEVVSSLVCRQTVLPAESAITVQPASLGDKLINITTDDVEERKNLKEKGGLQLNDDELTIHYRYGTSHSTKNCPNGLSTVITLICDTREGGNGTKLLTPKCVGGTCDGCHYQLIWRTKFACPKCDESDFERIVGECVDGTQTIRYLPPKHCSLTEEIKNKDSSQQCSLITMPIKMAIVGVGVVVVLLFACAVCCWKRSRKLEYKYMRLVEGAQGNAGELPAAQTCAWSDDDDEDDSNDRVAFKTKGDQLFGKLGSKKGKGDGFEKMKLVGGTLPEI